ncbi:MAG: helix-turn-helix transcriptional regulator [Marinosulfonomonas sp.]|nr:helix-turn-helix transcriptional regulator [Marinosulfonomonas sp.]
MVIRNLRIERGWSQEQLAEISGVSTRTIQRIERGGKASLESLKCLAAVFETPISDLQKDINMTNPDNSLTEEDRAALKYAHNLKTYDEKHKKPATDYNPEITEQEREVRKQVKRMKKILWLAGGLSGGYVAIAGH